MDTSPPACRHWRRQGHILSLLDELLPHGQSLTECPVSTADGVKAIDVAWLGPDRPEIAEDPQLLTRAPEICVEIVSPSNSQSEINEKCALYFDAGAAEDVSAYRAFGTYSRGQARVRLSYGRLPTGNFQPECQP